MARLEREIVIVGGGLTGLPLALALKQRGIEVTVIEAKTAGQTSPAGRRVLALALGSVRFLEALGVWSRLSEPPCPIRRIHISDRGHFGKSRLDAEEMGFPAFGYTTTASLLEQALEEAVEREGVELWRPVEVVDLEGGFSAVRLHLSDGRQLEAKLVVAADGDRSWLRQLAGIGVTTRDYGQYAVVSTVRSEIDPEGTAFERFTDEGPLALLPVAKRVFSLIWTRKAQRVEETMALDREAFRRTLQSIFGWRLGRLEEVGPRIAFPLKLVLAHRLFDERIVLIGNAAHRLHPVAGQGLNLGLRDVAVLAEHLAAARERGLDPGSRVVLERYAAKRKRDHEEVIRFCDGLVIAFTSEFLPLVVARNLGLSLFDRLLPLKRRFAERAMGLLF